MVTNCAQKEIVWIAPKKLNSKSCSDDWHLWRFWSAFRHFRTHFAESFRMSKSSWMMDPALSHEMPSCSAIDLAEIWQSSKISLWIRSVISRVVTVLGCPGRGASQVEKSPHLNWGHPVFDCGIRWCMFPLMFLSEWCEFPSAPCLAGKKKTWWQLTSQFCWNRVHHLTCFFPAPVIKKDLQFGTWTDPFFQQHYRFRPTTSGSRSG